MTSEYNAIKWEREGPIGILTFDRPEDMNAIGEELRTELMDFMDRLPHEQEVNVVIVTGSGKAFSAGGDLHGFLNRSTAHQEQGGAIDVFSNRMARKFLEVEIPLIAAVNGAAVGGAAGYMLGNEGDRKNAQAERAYMRQEMRTVAVNITNSNGSVSQVRLRRQGVGYVGTRGEYYHRLPTEDELRPIYGF